jgi:ATP-binding cassette subfamily C (CFTR/MRP) protein 1
MEFDTLITALSGAVVAAKTSLLFLEAHSKTIYFASPDTDRPPQETSGILNRSVFWWLNSLFLQGNFLNPLVNTVSKFMQGIARY